MLYSCYYTKKTPLGYGKIFFLLFSGWDSISMVFKREGKTLELKLSVSCGSRTEDCTQFIFYWKKTVVLHYSLHTTTISKDFRILQMKFMRQRCPEKESQSLSLIYKNGECSLDLVLALLYFKSVCLVVSKLVPSIFPYGHHMSLKTMTRSAATKVKLNTGIWAWGLYYQLRVVHVRQLVQEAVDR